MSLRGREGVRPEQGLAARVVRDLTRAVEGKNHEVYMDNYFSSVVLFEERFQKDVLCCGTLRTNRKGCPEKLKKKKVRARPCRRADLSLIRGMTRRQSRSYLLVPIQLKHQQWSEDAKMEHRKTCVALLLSLCTTCTWVE